MKNVLGFLLAAFWGFAVESRLLAQWVQTNGPRNGGAISCVAINENNLFVGADGGVCRSTDNGASWSYVNQGFPSSEMPIDALALMSDGKGGTNLFAGASGYTVSGAFRSTDLGNTWTTIDSGLANTNVTCLVVKGSNLFAGTIGGVFLSTNEGASWTAVNAGFASAYPNVWALATDGTDVYAGAFGDGVFISKDNGATWDSINVGLSNRNIRSLAAYDSIVFAGTEAGVFVSTNKGGSWSGVNSGLTNTMVMALAYSGVNIYAGTYGGVFVSSNNGSSWSPADSGLTSTTIFALSAYSTKLYAGTVDGGFLSIDGGASWTPSLGTIYSYNTYDLAAIGTSLFAGTSDNGVYRSNDSGADWTAVSPAGLIDVLAVDGDTLYAGGGGGVFLSADAGATWNNTNSGQSAACIAINDTSIFAGVNGRIICSTDRGKRWTDADSGIPFLTVNRGEEVRSIVFKGSLIFAGVEANDGGVFLSTNNGKFWSRVNSGLTNTYVYKLAVSGANLIAGTEGGVFISANNGTNWTNTYSSSVGAAVTYAFVVIGTNIFAGTDGGIILSTDNGNSWTNVSTGLSDVACALLVSGSYLYAGTFNTGVWRRPLSEMVTSVEQGSDQLPGNFVLRQNYPNPFNPSTTIGYQLPSNSFVVLRVYDILGREVRILVNEHQIAGEHLVTFDASGLPSGVYFYRLQVGNYTESKKLLLVK